MHHGGCLRYAARLTAARAQSAQHRIHVVHHDDHGLSERPVAAVAGEKQRVTVTLQRTERWVLIVASIHEFEVENCGVEGERLLHATAANVRDDRHEILGIRISSYRLGVPPCVDHERPTPPSSPSSADTPRAR